MSLDNSGYTLKVITTEIAIIWCDIFIFLSDKIKKRKPLMKDNRRLNISMEGYVANLNCLF